MRVLKALGYGFAAGALQALLTLLLGHGFHFGDWQEHAAQAMAGGIAGTLLVLKQSPKE